MAPIKETIKELKSLGYDTAIAIATNAEREAGAACGQMTLMTETQEC